MFVIAWVSCVYLYFLVFPCEDDSVPHELVVACSLVAPEKWESIALWLGLSDSERIEIESSSRVLKVRMQTAIEKGMQKRTEPTVKWLLRVFDQEGVARRVIEKRYLEYVAIYKQPH